MKRLAAAQVGHEPPKYERPGAGGGKRSWCARGATSYSSGPMVDAAGEYGGSHGAHSCDRHREQLSNWTRFGSEMLVADGGRCDECGWVVWRCRCEASPEVRDSAETRNSPAA